MTTTTFDTLAAALSALQAKIPSVAHDKTANVPTKSGGSYSYTYADLATVSAVVLPLLSAHGLAFTAYTRTREDGRYELVGELMHTSGESRHGCLPILGSTAQDIGGWITYGRRYLLGALTGVVTEKDADGPRPPREAKARPAARPAEVREYRPAPSDSVSVSTITPKQLGLLQASLKEAGIVDRTRALAFYADTIGRPVESSKDLTVAEASQVIDALKAVTA